MYQCMLKLFFYTKKVAITFLKKIIATHIMHMIIS
jgi:hypothetical protein